MFDKSKFQKRVTGIYTGQEFTIQRVRLLDYMREIGAVPVGIDGSIQALVKALQEHVESKGTEPDSDVKTLRFFLTRGVLPTEDTPGIWMDEPEKCPDTHIHYHQLGNDADFLVGQISTFSFSLPGLGGLGSTFLSRGDRGIDRPGSEEVRTETVESVAEKNLSDGTQGV